MSESTFTPRHQWTNGGKEVLILRYVDQTGKSYGGFQHPMKIGETVTAPDWNPAICCGGGIHGWPWGLSLGDGKEPDWSATWQVYGAIPEDIVGGSGALSGESNSRSIRTCGANAPSASRFIRARASKSAK